MANRNSRLSTTISNELEGRLKLKGGGLTNTIFPIWTFASVHPIRRAMTKCVMLTTSINQSIELEEHEISRNMTTTTTTIDTFAKLSYVLALLAKLITMQPTLTNGKGNGCLGADVESIPLCVWYLSHFRLNCYMLVVVEIFYVVKCLTIILSLYYQHGIWLMAPGSYYVHLIVFITFSFHKSKAFWLVKYRSLPIITQNIYIITFLKNIAPPPNKKKKPQRTTNWLSISKTCR